MIAGGKLRGQQGDPRIALGGTPGRARGQFHKGQRPGHRHRLAQARVQDAFPFGSHLAVGHQMPVWRCTQPAFQFTGPGQLRQLFLQAFGTVSGLRQNHKT